MDQKHLEKVIEGIKYLTATKMAGDCVWGVIKIESVLIYLRIEEEADVGGLFIYLRLTDLLFPI